MGRKKELELTFLGAAGTVTGSAHLLTVGDQELLVDCGLYQGRRQEAMHRNRHLPKKAVAAEAAILTHAHIDHCGNLPTLVRRGFHGAIHCTHATADLCAVMLRDAARIQQYDAEWLNTKYGDTEGWTPIEPLYTEADVQPVLDRLRPHAYGEPFSVLPGLEAHLVDAGHVLGSATAVTDVRLNGHRRRVVFSGDIGRRHLPILRDPQVPPHADYVVMESTYGARLHAAAEDMQAQLLEVIREAVARGGKIVVPSFALERTQEIVFALHRLHRQGKLPHMPVYVDSPLAVNLTEVFTKHEECYDAETLAFDARYGDPFGFDLLTFVESVEESRRLNSLRGPAMIISASGMCEAGRVLHHLRNTLEDPRNFVVIVGFQAQHTLGRRLAEGRRKVRLLGLEREVRAEVRVLDAFSAHADRNELLDWARACGPQVRRFFLVHGEADQSEPFARTLAAERLHAQVAKEGETVALEY